MPLTRAAVVALVVVALAGPARAEDDRDRTLVLVAPPAVLLDAVETSLAPWRIRIVVVPTAAAPAEQIAASHHAGFVAIGVGGELHLYDRTRGEQHRPMPADLGEADAAALALTIKTWMRLGPAPVAVEEPEVAAAPTDSGEGVPAAALETPLPAPTSGRTWQLGAGATVGVRGNQAGLGALDARVAIAAELTTRPVDLAVGLEVGAAVDVVEGDQRARGRELVAFVHAARRIALLRALTLRPIAGVAAVRVDLDGTMRMSGQPFAMQAWTVGLDAAVELGWRSGPVRAQVVAGITSVPMEREVHDRGVTFVLPAHVEPWVALGAQALF